MKGNMVTLRLSDEEYEKLQESANLANTTLSQYIRECINGTTIDNGVELQKAATMLCQIYIELVRRKIDPNDDILEVLNQLCQI